MGQRPTTGCTPSSERRHEQSGVIRQFGEKSLQPGLRERMGYPPFGSDHEAHVRRICLYPFKPCVDACEGPGKARRLYRR